MPIGHGIDMIEAWVNIGTLRSISHHVQCLNSQQLYIIELEEDIMVLMPRSHIHGMDAGISHGYNPASFVAIRIGPQLSVLHTRNYT